MEMHDKSKLTERVWAAVRSEPMVDLLRDNVRGIVDQTNATLEGQVGNISVKKRILKRVAAIPGLTHLVDRLRILPARRMSDRQIGTRAFNALTQDSTFAECIVHGCQMSMTRNVPNVSNEVAVSVNNGVVLLEGKVPRLLHKQLAGVLAWWVPGVRDVVNALVETTQEDNLVVQLTEAVVLALQKDLFIDSTHLQVSVRDATVYLRGHVPTPSERELAEFNAWYVFGVEGVENRIETGAKPHYWAEAGDVRPVRTSAERWHHDTACPRQSAILAALSD